MRRLYRLCERKESGDAAVVEEKKAQTKTSCRQAESEKERVKM